MSILAAITPSSPASLSPAMGCNHKWMSSSALPSDHGGAAGGNVMFEIWCDRCTSAYRQHINGAHVAKSAMEHPRVAESRIRREHAAKLAALPRISRGSAWMRVAAVDGTLAIDRVTIERSWGGPVVLTGRELQIAATAEENSPSVRGSYALLLEQAQSVGVCGAP